MGNYSLERIVGNAGNYKVESIMIYLGLSVLPNINV